MPDLKRNDVVQQLQGGPRMTVEQISATAENVTATCIWIDKKGEKRRKVCPSHALNRTKQ